MDRVRELSEKMQAMDLGPPDAETVALLRRILGPQSTGSAKAPDGQAEVEGAHHLRRD